MGEIVGAALTSGGYHGYQSAEEELTDLQKQFCQEIEFPIMDRMTGDRTVEGQYRDGDESDGR